MNHDAVNVSISNRLGDLVATGTFITCEAEETKMTLNFEEESVTLIFVFINEVEKENEKRRTFLEAEVIDNATAKLIFRNFTSPFGTVSTKPFVLGKLMERTLSLVYKITNLQGTEFKQIDYTFYLGVEEKSG